MKRTIWLLFIFLFYGLVACNTPGNRITSVDLKTPRQRIETLREFFNLKTEVLDADFDIFDVNLNADLSIPGPTSRDFKIVLFIDPKNADAWTDTGKITSFPVDFSWAEKVSTRLPAKLVESGGGVITRDGAKDMIVLKSEGIVIIRIQQL